MLISLPRVRAFVVVTASLAFATPLLTQDDIVVVGWNVESGGADPSVVATRMGQMPDVDIWGLSEVASMSWALQFEQEIDKDGKDFKPLVGNTGAPDLLAILYDKNQFDELETDEIGWADRYWLTSSMRPRSALIAKLRHKATGREFWFMVNHLYRGSGVDPRRLDQAKKLREWAAEQSLPVIAVGDYNFDWDLDAGQDEHNTQKGFGDMTAGGTFAWVEPDTLRRTQDSSFNSVLDFVFLANTEGIISGTSRIIVEPGDFPDDGDTPDHRPVEATLTFTPLGGTDSTKAEILARIAELVATLQELTALVQQMDG